MDDVGLGGLQRLEIWTGKSQAPERFGILLRSLMVATSSTPRWYHLALIVISMVDTSSGGTEMS